MNAANWVLSTQCIFKYRNRMRNIQVGTVCDRVSMERYVRLMIKMLWVVNDKHRPSVQVCITERL